MTKKRRTSRLIIGAAAILLCTLIGIIVWSVISRNQTINSDGTTPTFQAVLPENTQVEDLGGWQKHTSPSGDTYFAFADTIDGVLINVSQQQLPENFKSNIDTKVAEVAKGYNATRTLDVNGTKVYIGTKASGPQSIIFTENDVLVFIVSEQKIQDESWISYISSLR